MEKVYRPDLIEIRTKLFEAAKDRQQINVSITIISIIVGTLICVPIFAYGVKAYLKRAAKKGQTSRDIEMNNRLSSVYEQMGPRQETTQYSVNHTFERPPLTNENESARA